MNEALQAFLNDGSACRAAAAADLQAQITARRERPSPEPGPLDLVLANLKGEAPALPPLNRALEPLQPPTTPALEAYSAASICGVRLERPPAIVDGLLGAGLAVLPSPPKTGKSWLALLLCICVALGRAFLGLRVRQGTALYLDLESRQHRVQDRLARLLPGNFPEKLHVCHDARRLDDGFIDQLSEWVGNHPDTSLIVVDTLARIKGGSRRGENAYEADSRIFGELQRFAQQHKLCVLVVHHLKKSVKGDSGDPLERVSGSMGLVGIADTIMMLDRKRDEQTGVLHTFSRDFGSGEFALRFESGMWTLESTDVYAWRAEQEYAQSGVVRAVLALMRSVNPPEWQGETKQLLEALQGAVTEPLDVFNAAKLGSEIARLAPKLQERDGVFIINKRIKGRRVLSITQPKPDEL